MRLRTRFGIALVLVGCVTVLVSSSGFTSATADRTVALDETTDPSALLGISYPSGRPIELRRSDAFFQCFAGQNCWYLNHEVIQLTDNAPESDLEIANYNIRSGTSTNLTITSGPTLDQSGSGLGTVTTTFGCRASGNIFNRVQHAGTGWVELRVEAAGDDVRVTTTRNVSVRCIPG